MNVFSLRAGSWLLFGVFLYAFFFGLLHAREEAITRLRLWTMSLPFVRLTSRPALSFFPPALDIAALETTKAGIIFDVRDLVLKPVLWPARVLITGRVNGDGSLRAVIIPSSVFSPESLDVMAELDAMQIRQTDRNTPATRGGISGRLQGRIALSPEIPASRLELEVNLRFPPEKNGERTGVQKRKKTRFGIGGTLRHPSVTVKP